MHYAIINWLKTNDLGGFCMEGYKYPEHLVFGLDIGTRSLVGTVGYKENDSNFKVIAQCVKEHETRAMLDGQIHDIPKVAESIEYIKNTLEKQIGKKLNDVCIAAAGRVLKTINVKADYEFVSETVVNDDHIHSLDLLGVEKAYDVIREEMKDDNSKYYCVGYTAVRYYLNNYIIMNLEGHKASNISVDLLATFLPEEVIDSLYIAVEKAGLQVASLTLEPIAAINIAIPEKFRLLNIALVDVGAGTSDISITKDGSIIAYGMIPFAGDEVTEMIVQKYLVEFNTAEKIKIGCLKKKTITYKDIMGLSHKILPEEVIKSVEKTIDKITKGIADRIIELNGDKSVSAVFVVGGGGKIPTFVTTLAKHLGLAEDRVALRGAEVLNEIEFLQPGIKKDPLIVTPIGICLNFYNQRNNFITVTVNDERVKLYDNSKLTIVDAALQTGFSNDKIFPRRGNPINFSLDGAKRLVRGELGEAAIIKLNSEIASINSSISQNDKIEIRESTMGADAVYEIGQLPEYKSTIEFIFNGKKIICPKFVMVNEKLVSQFYSICDGDEIKILNYYSLEQIIEFMDVEFNGQIEVNHVVVPLTEKVYENFSIDCNIGSNNASVLEINPSKDTDYMEEGLLHIAEVETAVISDIIVVVNKTTVKLSGKDKYILVDILDFYYFDTTTAKGTNLSLKVNGEIAEFTNEIKDGDIIEIYWEN